ncbi:MAG: 3-hydroxy-3-methylglutaryl-CoA reductase, partial [Anaerolineales bacterium]
MKSQENKPAKFYQLNMTERLEVLIRQANLTREEADILSGAMGLAPAQADHMIENAVGIYGLPLGIAQNFLINGREVLVPMVIEEPSVIAGASFMAKLARTGGGFIAHADPPEMIGQIQILDVDDPYTARLKLLEYRDEILDAATKCDCTLEQLGGGARSLEVQVLEQSPIGQFLVLNVVYDVRDAMGANA